MSKKVFIKIITAIAVCSMVLGTTAYAYGNLTVSSDKYLKPGNTARYDKVTVNKGKTYYYKVVAFRFGNGGEIKTKASNIVSIKAK